MYESLREKILSQPSAMKEVYSEDTVNPHAIVRGPDGWHLFYGPMPGPHNDAVYHATSDDLVVWTRQEPVVRQGASGECDAQEIADCTIVEHEGRWFITHALRPFGKPSTKRPYLEPLRGLYIGGLIWSGGVPVPVDLNDVLRE